MSMPNIPDITPDFEFDRAQAITLLLASIAMEEMGLAHILNAEGQKMEYVLELKSNKNVCIHDILALNDSIERIIKSISRLQIILQDKMDNVVRLIPGEWEPSPCPKPPRPKPKCILVGNGTGTIRNPDDSFCGAIVTLAALEKCEEGTYPFKYTLFMRGKKGCNNISVAIVPITSELETKCEKLQPCPTPERPNIMLMHGRAIMCITGVGEGTHQATVNFKLEVWDYGLRQQFRTTTWLENNELYSHNSGIVEITQGDLRIKKTMRQEHCPS